MLTAQRVPALLRGPTGTFLIVALGAVAVVVSVVLVAPGAGEASTAGLKLRLALLTALCLAPFVIALFDRRVDLLSPLVLVSAAFFLLYAARGWALEGDRQPGLDLTPRAALAYGSYITPTIDLAICGVVAFYFGYLWRAGGALARSIPRPRPPLAPRHWHRAGVIFLIVGLPCLFISPILPGGGLASPGTSELVLNLVGLAPIGFVFLAAARRDADSAQRRRLTWILAVSLAIMLGAGLLFAHKATVLWALLAGAGAWHYLYRPLRPLQVATLFAFFALVAFPAVQTLRHELDSYPGRPGKSYPAAVANTPRALIVNEIRTGQPRESGFTPWGYVSDAASAFTWRLSGVDSLLVSRALTPTTHPYLNGSTYERLPASFIPRQLWAGKPELSLGPWFAVNYWGRVGGGDHSAQPIGLIGELYLNFGAGAVFFGMFLFGLMCRTWYAYLSRAWTPAAIGIYLVSLPSIVQVEGDSVLLLRTGTSRVVVAALVVLALGLWLRRQERIPAPGQ